MTMVIDNTAHLRQTDIEDSPVPTSVSGPGVRLRATEVLAWFAAQDDEAIVGYSISAHRCPLACYLHAHNGGQWDVVNDHLYVSIGRDGVPRPRPTPAWAKGFMVRIDLPLPDHRPITASEAYAALVQTRHEIAKDQAQFGWTEEEDEGRDE